MAQFKLPDLPYKLDALELCGSTARNGMWVRFDAYTEPVWSRKCQIANTVVERPFHPGRVWFLRQRRKRVVQG